MKKINCLVADDELLSREVVETYISRLEKLELAGKCKNGIEVFNMLKTIPVDLVFLDIQMPLLTGIELLKTIKNLPQIVFTTAYKDFAVEGYELNVLDYLLKPISFERFLKSIDKYENLANDKPGIPANQIIQNDIASAFIYVKAEKKMLKIYLVDILFIEGMKDYVKIKTIQKDIFTYQTLSDFEQRLPESSFLRIHRSYIAALNKINSYTAGIIEIAGYDLPIGSYYQKNVLKVLKP
ncbi:MAG: LytTR family DNA-binding domain-containing protein [Ferruginibacter sp.]